MILFFLFIFEKLKFCTKKLNIINNQSFSNMKLKKLAIFLLIINLSLLQFCKKDRHSSIIPQKKFTEILTEIHIADALLTKENKLDAKLKYPDSLSYYNQIFKKYNVSREQFYNSITYYMQDMQTFIDIEKSIVDTLNARFQILDSLERLSLAKQDLWQKKREWTLPDDGVTNAIPFQVIANQNGIYNLIAEVLLYPDDMSKDLKMKIHVDYTDGTSDERTVKIVGRNATWQQYSISLTTNPNKQVKGFVSGEVLSHASSTTYMHLRVRNIMLTYAKYPNADTTNNQLEIQAIPDS